MFHVMTYYDVSNSSKFKFSLSLNWQIFLFFLKHKLHFLAAFSSGFWVVISTGGKDTPILIGRSETLHCLANVHYATRPCGAEYFINNKAWMKSDDWKHEYKSFISFLYMCCSNPCLCTVYCGYHEFRYSMETFQTSEQ